MARITTSMRIGVSRTSTLHKRSGEFSPGPAGHGGRSRIGRDSPGVAVLAQLAAEELVELGPEDAIGDELPLLAHRLGASRHRGLSYAAKEHEELGETMGGRMGCVGRSHSLKKCHVPPSQLNLSRRTVDRLRLQGTC